MLEFEEVARPNPTSCSKTKAKTTAKPKGVAIAEYFEGCTEVQGQG